MDDLKKAKRSAERMLEHDACSRELGIAIDVHAPGSVSATMTVTENMLNGFDVCHGGIVFTLADTAFAFACNAYNRETLSVSANIEWLRPVVKGDVLTAVASEDTLAGRHGYYSVNVHNQKDEIVALFHGHSVTRDRPLFDEA